MIAQKSVQEIIETAKIEEVVEEFVNLKRRGVNMIGLCPFHNEKTPSFIVSPAKNICKCFGCGKGGGPVQFMMEHEQLSFPEALRYLAKKYNIEIEETVTSQESIEERQLNDSLYLINEFARDFYQDQLFNTNVGKSVGLSYFKSRGFREETIKKFGLGFAPDGKDKFTLTAINKGYNIDLLRKLGLTSKYDSDFFRNRVMFTIHNLTGKVIGFGGRILQKNVKAPKYINSPETEIYFKSKVLYGAYFAKKAIRQKDECIMVEGYTDVISLHQAGIENVVASSGTSLTVEQIRLIKRYTPNIKILYDGDAAGIKAALRGLDLVLEQDMNVKVVLLPDGEDPDSYLQSVGSTAFEEYIETEAKDFILFKTDLLLKEAGDDPIKKVKVTQDIINSIARIPDPLKRSVYIQRCATLTEIDEKALIESVNKQVVGHIRKRREDEKRAKRQREREQKQQQQSSNPPPSGDMNFPDAPPPETEEGEVATDILPTQQKTSVPSDGSALQERDIIRLLLNSGAQVFDKEDNITVAEYILGNIEDVLDDFDDKKYEAVAKAYYQRLLDNQTIDLNYFLTHEDKKIGDTVLDIVASRYELSPNWLEKHGIELQTQKMPEENFTDDSINALLRFKFKKVVKMCEANQQKLRQLTSDTDPNQLMLLMKMQQKLINMRNDLAKQLKTVVLK